MLATMSAENVGCEPRARATVNLTVYAPVELRRAAKVYAAQRGTTVSALVIKLLSEHLSRETSG